MSKLKLQELFFFIILVGLTLMFYHLISPFIVDIFLTIILIIIFKKPTGFFIKKFKGNTSKAAFATLFLIILVIIIPLFFIGLMVSKEASNTYAIIKSNWDEISRMLQPEQIKSTLGKIPWIGDYLSTIDFSNMQSKVDEAIAKGTTIVLSGLQSVFMNLTMLIVHFCIIMFLLYYMVADGKAMLEKIHYLLPLKDSDEKEFLEKLEKVTDALVLNTFTIGLIEGVWGGLLFTIVGIPSPFFWGTVMVIFSIIPFLGSNTILFPAAIIELLIGNYWKGIILLVFGVSVVFINQHIIRNRLDGSRSGMHPAIVFLACFGGMMSMGMVGFIAGPIIAALFLVIWNQFGKKYHESLVEINNPEQMKISED